MTARSWSASSTISDRAEALREHLKELPYETLPYNGWTVRYGDAIKHRTARDIA